MTRLRALNETSSDDSEEESDLKETIEAQEERAFSVYQKALELRHQRKYADAEQLLIALLNDDFLINVSSDNKPAGSDGLASPAAALKYACLKNLGSILVLQDRAEDGLQCFIQAVELDESDVTMWHQMGNVALQVDNFHLASQAFQEGLRCNARHWPCLDSLMPVLFASNDYLGCLLLVSRTLHLDPDYPQALALRDQIFKEQPSLMKSFKDFFPDEIDIAEVSSNVPEEEIANLVLHAQSLQERHRVKNASKWLEPAIPVNSNGLMVTMQSITWEDLGKYLLQTYHSICTSVEKSFLQPVKIMKPTSGKVIGMEGGSQQSSMNDTTLPLCSMSSIVAEPESEPMDADSEQDVKVEDQTEEDATEASGLEQEEDVRATSTVQESSSALKRKRKRASLALMDQWSKRRSGRRVGRKAEDKEESKLSSCFRSLLPDSLLPKDLEGEIAKASKKRALRDPVDLLAYAEDSMDTVELCRLLQERDAKDDLQNKVGQNMKDSVAQLVGQGNYFGTDKEISDVCAFIENYGCGAHNIIELLLELTCQLAQKECLTWPFDLVPICIEVYECMRRHIPYPSLVDMAEPNRIKMSHIYASLLFCELYVDLWQQKSQKEQDILGERGLKLAAALGHVMLLSGLSHLFPSAKEHYKIMIRIHWVKVHLFLIQENSSAAISSLQDVLKSLDLAESEEEGQEKEASSVQFPGKKSGILLSTADREDISAGRVEVERSLDSVSVIETEIPKGQNDGTIITKNLTDISLEVETRRKFSTSSSINSLSEKGSEGKLYDVKTELVTHSLKETVPLESAKTSECTSQGNRQTSKLSSDSSQITDNPLSSKIKDSESTFLIKEEIHDEIIDVQSSKVMEGTLDNLAKASLHPQERNSEFDLNIIKVEKSKQITGDAESVSDISDERDNLADCKKEESGAEPLSCDLMLLNDNNSTKDKSINHASVGRIVSGSADLSEAYDVGPSPLLEPVEITVCKDVKSSSTNVCQEPDGNVPKKALPSVNLEKVQNKDENINENSLPLESCVNSCRCDIVLPNSRVNQVINKRTAQKLLSSLTRQRQLREVDDLYKSQQYEILAGTLTECFKYCAQQVEIDSPDVDNLPDRPTQMAMLLDSLWQLQRYNDCFYWTEACLHEAFNRYLNSTDSDNSSQDQDDHQMWATTVERLLAGLNGCLKLAGLQLLEKLPKTCLTRLVQTLTSMLCQQLEQTDCSVEMAIECTTPWVILHRIVFFEEQQQLPKSRSQDCIPSHMRILFTAHECMAKRSRCCLNEGILLNLIMDVVVPQIRSTELAGVRTLLNHEVEQAILCLYGHPKKSNDRSKKKLQDHKVHQQLELTWERSLTLLQFYEPDELPSFDCSSKISPDEEQLFLRVLQLVPPECSPNQHLSKMKAFLRGLVPTFPDIQCSLPASASNLYYLLADYYLKTFKWNPAVKYYMLDVCVNPHRFDSWAGMALARATSLTLDINSCDTFKNEMQLLRKTEAQQCFEQAVELDPENCTMWIEFGSFAYTVHSFCSRLLKTETDSLSMDMFTKIEEEKDRMLAITEKCFKTAEKLGQDERWLHQYMLGKVAEKRGEGPVIFLQHYRAAARLLFESNAEYPLSLNYDPPQLYAFEAHEVFYRIHASILKTLEATEGKSLSIEIRQLYEETLQEAAQSPFMAARQLQSLSMTTNMIENQSGSIKRPLNPLETSVKKIKLDELTGIDPQKVTKKKETDASCSDITLADLPSVKIDKSVTEVMLLSHSTLETCEDSPSDSSRRDVKCPDMHAGQKHSHVSENILDIDVLQISSFMDVKVENGNNVERSESSSPSTMLQSNVCASSNTPQKLRLSEMNDSAENVSSRSSNLDVVLDKGSKNEASPPCEVDGSKFNPLLNQGTEVKGEEFIKHKKKSVVSNDATGNTSFSSESPSSEDSCDDSKNAEETPKQAVTQNSKKDNELEITKASKEIASEASTSSGSLSNSSLIHQCLVAMEECLVRYNRHYKSFYRLCHYYFHSKLHQNLRKCRQLLLGEYRVIRVNKNVNGLFKSVNVNSMFSDVWRMPIEEIDRAGSFASHMSRCVHLLMELLRAQHDHAFLLKLSVFLKREPEKKDKKYLRDLERVDLSKQALVMCLAALRESVNLTRSSDNVIEIYRTVKVGVKELPQKEGTLKNLLSDAYKKFKGFSKEDTLMYDVAVDFCQNELNLRKAAADAKAKAQAAAQAMQMGTTMFTPSMTFGNVTPRFPTGANVPPARVALNNPVYIPQIPGYRGRGRPPKTPKTQPLHEAMMSMAQMMGLKNAVSQAQGTVDTSQLQIMMHNQRQQYQQAGSLTSSNSNVSSLIDDRPALSITPLGIQNTAAVASVTSATTSTSNLQTVSPIDMSQSVAAGWQVRPQHNFPNYLTPQSVGSVGPRSHLRASGSTGVTQLARKSGPRFKSVRKSSPASTFGSPGFSRPFTSQSQRPRMQGDVMISRLPQTQSAFPSAQQFKYTRPNEMGKSADRVIMTARQQLQSMERKKLPNPLSSKPALSISKVPTSTITSQPLQSTKSENPGENKKTTSSNFDVIVLD